MNRFHKTCALIAFMLGGLTLAGCNGARDTALDMVGKNGEKGFMIKQLTRGDRTRNYGLFVPLNYNAANKYPIIIFLHGVGEGAGMGEGDELDAVAKAYPGADLTRVSLTGLSTGGYGTWAIGSKYKNRFAALVPMGSSESCFDQAPNLVNMPIRCYHNNGDIFAAMWNDEVMVEKIRSLGGKAEMFKTNGPGHDCWEIAYGETDLFAWLEQQRRPSTAAAETPIPAKSSSAAPAPAVIHTNVAAVVTPY